MQKKFLYSFHVKNISNYQSSSKKYKKLSLPILFLTLYCFPFLFVFAKDEVLNTTLCSNVEKLKTAKELTQKCSLGSTDNCILDSIYKISKDTGSQTNLLPPIVIPKNTALCITNETLTGSATVYAQSFFINGGTLQIGTITNPLTSANKVTIVMSGNQSASMAPQPLCATNVAKCSSIASTTYKTPNARDITVSSTGQLLMYGAKGTTKSDQGIIHHFNQQNVSQSNYFNTAKGSNSWTYLSQSAGPAYYSESMWVEAPVDFSNLSLSSSVNDLNSALPTTTSIPTPTLADYPYIVTLAKNIALDHNTRWESGDWISVSTTTFSSHQTEIVQVCKIYQNKQSKNSVIVLAGSPSYQSACPLIANDTPLKHYHFGSQAPTLGYFDSDQTYQPEKNGRTYQAKKGQAKSFYDGKNKNFGIDERAEVALLSRNIKLTSLAGNIPKFNLYEKNSETITLNNQYFGGHIAIMNMSPQKAPQVGVNLVGVEIEKFGQALVGRYPIHFHRINQENTSIDANLLIQDTSVHHSYNKCFVTHDSMGIKFYNNSCVRTIGQGFYLEDGHNIMGNHYVRNLVSGTMAAALNYDINQSYVTNGSNQKTGYNQFWDGDYLAATKNFNYNPAKIPDTSNSGANTGNYLDSFNPSGFWITTFGGQVDGINYPNIFINNSVAGCQMKGAAYWFVRQDINNIDAVPSSVEADLYPVFSGNRGHACYDGVMSGINSAVLSTPPLGPPPKPVPVNSSVDTSVNAPLVLFDNLTFTQIERKAFWYRGVFIAITNGRFSALKQGMTLLGGGGPEGNLLGFWGLVQDSVFAAVTNNNVGRYSDCENYFKTYASSKNKLKPNDALQLNKSNEMGKCAPINFSNVSISPPNPKGNNQSLFGDIVPNFNFQGYTFYDGPARMEDNRFINFRADPTNPTYYKNSDDNTPGKVADRYLVTKIDAHRMMNYQHADQLASNYTSGGNNYYGYTGDAAFSWLKGNAQSVPPTQYTLGNIWENTNYKHQIFSEISNLQAPLQDGDKQTVEIDRDTSLSGYYLCQSSDPTQCSNTSGNPLNHYPTSLNNLNVFATKDTTNEPHSRSRNNVVSSALMSPYKYATVNIGVAKQGAWNHLEIKRDLRAYNQVSRTTMLGRGGQSYIYEAMVMNNMGYTYSTPNNNGNTQLIMSYSDAPVDSLFINRVGMCVGQSATNIEIYKVPRQWNSGVNYLQPSPYFTNQDITNTAFSCPSIVTNSQAYTTCQATAKKLTAGNEWGKVSAYANGKKDLNTNYFNAISINYKPLATAKPVDEGYYYDKTTGILYFNMIQHPQSNNPLQPLTFPTITPPYATCDKTQFKTAATTLKQYLTSTNNNQVQRALNTGCYVSAKNNLPTTSELLTCPREGCAVYTVGYTSSNKTPSCQSANWSHIEQGEKPAINSQTHQITYASPYQLYDASDNTRLQPKPFQVTVKSQSGNIIRHLNYVQTTPPKRISPIQTILLPLAADVYTQTPPVTVTMNTAPSGIKIIPFEQSSTSYQYHLNTASSNVTLTATAKNFTNSSGATKTITSNNQSTAFNLSQKAPSSFSAVLNYNSKNCTLTFSSGDIKKTGSCVGIVINEKTIITPAS